MNNEDHVKRHEFRQLERDVSSNAAQIEQIVQLISPVEYAKLISTIDELAKQAIKFQQVIFEGTTQPSIKEQIATLLARFEELSTSVNKMRDAFNSLQKSPSTNISVTGKDMSDERNQSVTAGRDARTSHGLTARELKLILMAIVATAALAFGYRILSDDGRIEATPQAVETQEIQQ